MEYLVNVAVHGVAGLSFGDKSQSLPNPFVRVAVFGETRETRAVDSAATCSLDNFFSVSKRQKPDDFAAEDVTVTVLHSGSLGLSKVLGQVVFSLQKVRAQKQHMVETAWFPVVVTENPGEVRGFVRLTLGAYGPGDRVPRASGASGADTSGNDADGSSVRSRAVQLPCASNAVKSLYQLCVRVHQAEALQKVSGTFSEGCHPFVRVDFNGTSQKTQTQSSTSPVWNEEVRVPCMMPCWDNSVNVRVMSQGGPTSKDALLGELCVQIDDLDSQFKPAWHNFYAPKESERSGLFGGQEDADPSAYAGRLLVSACIQRVEMPELSVGAGPVMRPPPVAKHVLWADFYEVCFDSVEQPQEAFACVSMEPFLGEVKSKAPERHEFAFAWPEDTGRIAQEMLMLPELSMCSDIIVDVYARFSGWLTSSNCTRHMYFRIPLANAMNWDAKPRWYEMRHVAAHAGLKTAGFILMSLNVGPQGSAPKRPRREQVRMKSYTFRSYIYQAANLPIKDIEGTSDPFVVVLFGSAELRTEIVGSTLNPSWFQVLEATVEVPENQALRPDIHLIVADHDDDRAQPMVRARYSTREAGSLPSSWRGAPQWLSLEPMPGGVPTQGRLLAAFELEPLPAKLGAVAKVATPAVQSCNVEFYAVGVRIKAGGPSLKAPRLQVAWGRREDDRSEPKKAKYTHAGRGSDGQFNFLEQVNLTCKLAKDPLYQDWLEVRLLTDDEHDETVARSVAFATVQLAKYLPWIDEVQRQKAERDFKVRRLSHLSAAENALKRASMAKPVDITQEEEKKACALWKRGAEAAKDRELHLCRSLGWDVDSIEASNARHLGACEFTNLTDEDTTQCNKVLEDCLTRYGAADGPEWGAALTDFCQNFEWPLDEGFGDDLERHPDQDCELDLGGTIPYSRVDLLVGTEWGEAEVIGVLKFCCRVVERERAKKGGPEVEQENEAWQANIRKIERTFREAQDLSVRAYILSADGLTPCSGSSDCSTYIWSRATSREDEQAHNFRDNLTVRHHTLHPQFHKCHTFAHCRFPENSMLEVSVVELVPGMFGGVAAETPIGSTVIDLEDRWFNQRYHSMVKEDAVPIEARELHTQDSSFSRGHLRLWIDMMTGEESQARKLATLPSTEPFPFQLRMVIWKVTHIEMANGEVPDIYVSGRHELDDGTKLEQRTDTHFGADDGMGTFNWRLIFDLKVPCRDPRLMLRVWNDKFITDDPLAEVTLDLSRDFLRARRENNVIELPRGSIRLTHPAFPGDVCGVLDLEGLLLPQDEAVMRPVGAGHEEPNEDPFLDPEDPHRKAHRDYMGNLAIVKNVQALAGGIFMGAKIMTVLYILGGAMGSIVFVITTIVTLTK